MADPLGRFIDRMPLSYAPFFVCPHGSHSTGRLGQSQTVLATVENMRFLAGDLNV